MRFATLCCLTTLLASGLTGCVASDDSDHVTFVAEYEPNNTAAQANTLGTEKGLYAFSGKCDLGETSDWYAATSDAGVLELTLTVSDHAPQDPSANAFAPASNVSVSVALRDPSDTVISEAASVTPATPANLSGPLNAAGGVKLHVGCSGTELWYFGTLRIP